MSLAMKFLQLYLQKNHKRCLTICIRETPKWFVLQTVNTQMKCRIMQDDMTKKNDTNGARKKYE